MHLLIPFDGYTTHLKLSPMRWAVLSGGAEGNNLTIITGFIPGNQINSAIPHNVMISRFIDRLFSCLIT